MALLVIVSGAISPAQYDLLRQEVDWERHTPPGMIFHAAGFDDQGRLHAADVWESEDLLTAFVGQRLMPAIRKLGLDPPEVAAYPMRTMDGFGAGKP